MSEKKTINYNGMELECIESGYWPDGVTLVGSNTTDLHKMPHIYVHDGVCLCNGRAFSLGGPTSLQWKYWAILPPKPAPRRLTNREVAKLCRAGWDACVCGTVSSAHEYSIHDEKKEAEDTVLRAPNSDEWLEPTSDLLEVGE